MSEFKQFKICLTSFSLKCNFSLKCITEDILNEKRYFCNMVIQNLSSFVTEDIDN